MKQIDIVHLYNNHVFYVDNWYSNPTLFMCLLQNGTGACGTVRAQRKSMPWFSIVPRGYCIVAHTSDLLAIKWRDKSHIHLLTSVYTAEQKSTGEINKTGEKIMKPECVIEYNTKMDAVNKVHMQISFVECASKFLK